jgi:hypothetical membrane protein
VVRDRLRWWTLTSAAAAPVVLVGGWSVAAACQPAGYDPIRDTISSLAATGAPDRWVMTTALAAVGACYLVTAIGFRPARRLGRLVLALGGLGTLSVAAFPQSDTGNSGAHTAAAAVAFTALAAWPVFAARRVSGPVLLRVPASLVATVVMVGLVLWFVSELHGSHRGLAERAAAGAESLWPLAVVIAARLWVGPLAHPVPPAVP